MSSVPSSPVSIQTSPESVPSVPAWFGEVTLIARHLEQQGMLGAVSEKVRFARRRFGHYEVIDFFAVVLGYAVSGEETLEGFYKRLRPFGSAFMALFGRDRLPHRSTLSRFLAAIDQASVELVRTLFLQDLLARPFTSEKPGGLWDRQGVYWVVFDVDGTRSAARQRALPKTVDLPCAARRMDNVCAPGYTGRKRGELVRTRTTVLQSHTHEFLGTFSGSGNGDYRGELLRASEVICAYVAAKQIPPSQAIIRLDGLYGNGCVVEDLNGLSYVMRGREYDLLALPQVQARLSQPPDGQVTHPETGVCRTLYDCPAIILKETGVGCRVIVATHPENARPSPVGTTRDGLVYELFFTSLPPLAFRSEDVLQLYLHRGGFECTLSDEDGEQDPDRWCSLSSAGQEFWQIISQWVWNLREELGQHLQQSPMRMTEFSPALPTSQPESVAAPQLPTPTYTQPQWASAAQMGGFPGSAFIPQDDGTLRCPVGAPLYATEHRPERDGSIRVVYSARIGACRACPLRQECQGYGSQTKKPRRVSAVLWPLPDIAPQATPDLTRRSAPCPILWGDWSRTQHRRAWLDLLRSQTVIVTLLPKLHPEQAPSAPFTRSQRAHWRLSWSQRLARNAAPPTQAQAHIHLFGIPSTISTALNLAVG